MQNMNPNRRNLLLGTLAAGATAATPLAVQAAVETLPDVEKPGKTPHTPFAVNLEMWFRGAMEKRVEDAAALGFPSVEFWPYQDRDIDAIAKALESHQMTCSQFTAWGFGTELNNPQAGPERFQKAIEESCLVAEKLPGCDLFTVVLGNNIKELSKEAMHAAAVEKIKTVVPLLEKHKKTIIIEPMNPYNHPGHCLYGSADGIAVCKAVGSEWVKLNWDFFHMQRFEGNLIDNLRKGIDYVGYLQLADSPDRNEPGTGEVNYTELFKVIQELGYKRPVGLECSPKGGDVVRAAKRIYAADTW
jgi:hydroxypyruvate isomerase